MKLYILLISSALLMLIQCVDPFVTSFEEVENTKMRTIAFVYDNHGYAEGAPGDTIDFKALFAGKDVKTARWTATTSILAAQFGTDTFKDTFSLMNWIVPGTYKEALHDSVELTDTISFSFVIPQDVIKKQFTLSQRVISLIPSSTQRSSSALLDTLTIGTLFFYFDLLSALGNLPMDSSQMQQIAMMAGDSTGDLIKMLPVITQLFSTNMKIFSQVNDTEWIKSTFVIRYNTALKPLFPEISANKNPDIGWVKLVRIRGKVLSFDPLNDYPLIDSTIMLYNKNDTASYNDIDTIPIDDNYSYFLVADSAVSTLDSGISLTSGNKQPEIYYYQWMYRNDDLVDNYEANKLFKLQQGFYFNVVKILPSYSAQMKHFSIWLVVYDNFLGEKYRPVGFQVKEIRGYFKYIVH
jgi:hypothetical protein